MTESEHSQDPIGRPQMFAFGSRLPKLNPLLVAVVLISSIAASDLTISPFEMSSIIARFHVVQSVGALAMAIQFGVFTLAAFACSASLEKIRMDVVGRLAALMVVAGQAISYFSPTVMAVIAARTITGIGEGVLVALTLAFMSQRLDSSRLLAIQSVLGSLCGIVLALIVPPCLDRFGPMGVFVPPGVLCAVMLPLSLALPGYHLAKAHRAGSAAPEETKAKSKTNYIGAPFIALIMAVIFAIMISASSNLLWLYSAELGLRDGLNNVQIGQMIAFGQVLFFSAPVLAHITFRKFGEFWPAMVICVIMAVTGWYFAMTNNAVFYVIDNYLENFAYVWGVVLMRMACAKADRSGRSTAAAGGGDAAGWVIGPIMAGLVSSVWPGYLGITLVAVVTCFIAAAAVGWRKIIGVAASAPSALDETMPDSIGAGVIDMPGIRSSEAAAG